MRTFLYNTSVQVLKVLLPLFARLSSKVNLFYIGRISLLDTIKKDLSSNNNNLFWVHCSSVGEFEQGLPVIELLKKTQPTWKVLVTFFSPSGFESVNHSTIDYKYYLPYDTHSNATRFLEIIKPKIAVFIKYEYWYHFLKTLNKNKIPTYSVSSIFRPSQTFFKWYGGWNRKMLKNFTYFMVQDQPSVELLNSIGLENVKKTGDTRFDRVLKIKEAPLRFPEIENLIKEKPVFLIGSLRPEDNEIIFPFIKSNLHYAFIIAPHDITEKHITKIEQSIDSTVRLSELTAQSKQNCLIIDSVGKLSRLYRLADFAYVGGGFSDGIHNILEPAVYHIPIFFGDKHYKKYKEAVDLVKLEAAFPVHDASTLEMLVKKVSDPVLLENVCTKIENYVTSNKGAAGKVVDIINDQEVK